MTARFSVGDQVKPTADWENGPQRIPSGRVRKIEQWGKSQAIFVDGDHRAFVDDVFERVAE